MPAVGGPIVGNLGMDWHASLPSFDKAKAPTAQTAVANLFFPNGSAAKPKAKLAVKQIGMKRARNNLFLIPIFQFFFAHWHLDEQK
jgi:hypothetical protein